MFSLSTRFNVILYNMMTGMVFMGALNYLIGYYGTHNTKDLKFEITQMDMFIHDRSMDEEIASFQFNFIADLTDLFNWNTNIIFLSIQCEFETK